MRLLILILFIFPSLLCAQVIADFSTNSPVCIDENLSIFNLSSSAESYEWEFCPGDIESLPVGERIITDNFFNKPLSLKFLSDDSLWFAFVPSRSGDQLVRMDFGNNPQNVPAITNLGNLGNLLDGPVGIDLIKQENRWYGMVINLDNSEVIKLDFGEKLSNIPITSNLGDFGQIKNPDGIIIVKDNNNFKTLISAKTKVYILDFGSTLDNNNPTIDDFTISGSNRLWDISLIKNGFNWYGLISSFNNSKLYHLNFGSAISSSVAITEINLGSVAIGSPADLEFIREGELYYGIIASRTGKIYRLMFGNDPSPTNPSIDEIGNLNTYLNDTGGLSLTRNGTHWFGLISNFGNNSIYNIQFSSPCYSSIGFSTSEVVENLQFNNHGDFNIILTAFDNQKNNSIHKELITIKKERAPTIIFKNDNKCLNIINQFYTSSSVDLSITTWNWDFGDGIGTSSQQNPSYQYQNPGDYLVTLNVEAENGCTNYISDSVYIYNPPAANFSYPETIICSNNEIAFQNETVFSGPDSLLSFQWNVNEEALYDTTAFNYTFTSGGQKQVTLTADLTGCKSEVTKSIDITPGPLTDFDFIGNCVYDTYNFSNTTLGDDITGYLWDFGDGYTSANISPTHQYVSGGTYAVSLTASNAQGCNTSFKQVVPVHFTPTTNFTNDLTCSDNSVIFYDQTSVENANITDQHWTLTNDDLDYLETGTGPSPSFLLGNAGNYQMKLVATSNYGCSDTLVRNDINVRPSPIANFTTEETCYGDSTLFHDMTELPADISLTSVEWIIDGNLYLGNELKHKFNLPGEYDTELYVRADNFCMDNTSKVISITALPEIGIDLSSYCEDQPVIINSSINSADSVITYNWQINDKPVSNLESFIYDFDKVGLYNIGLGVTTENYCYNYQSQEITINPSPVSEFELFPSIGANPLNVVFTDLSQGASKVLYDFSENNSDTSEEFNPEYTYITLGKDWPKQIAENEYGCTDTSYSEIEVVIPIYDLTLSKANIEVTDQKLKMVIEIINNGSIIVNNPELKIDIDTKISLSHKLEGRLWPEDKKTFTVDFDVILNNQSLNYICFTLNTELGNYKDLNPYDNSDCLNIDNSFNVLEPYPNPSSNFVFVPIILPSPGACEILMTNEEGATLFQNEYTNMKSGLNLFKIDLSIYNQGLYMLVIKHKQFENTKKIVVN